MVIGAAVLWGFIGVFIRILSEAGLDTMQINGARSVICTILLAIVLFVYDRRGARDIYYKIGVKFSNAEGKYNCKLDKFDYLTNNKKGTFKTASVNPQEIVDFTTHKIHSKAKPITIE